MFDLPKDKFIAIFLNEASDIVESLEADLLELENNSEDADLINKIFRSVHTLKGSAGTVGLDRMRDFTHVTENLLEKVRSGKTQITGEIIDVSLKYLDVTKMMLANIGEDGTEAYDSIDAIDDVYNEVKKLLGEEVPQKEEAPKEEKKNSNHRYAISLVYKENIFEHGIDPLMFIRELEEKGSIVSMKVHTENLPSMSKFDPFKCYLSFTIDYESENDYNEISDIFIFVLDDNKIIIEEVDSSNALDNTETEEIDTEEEKAEEAEGLSKDEESHEDAHKRMAVKKSALNTSTVRVATGKLDSMMNLVGELVIAQSRIMQIVKELEVTTGNELDSAVTSLDRITREIQEEVMNIRMMPIAPIFMQFQRFVRDVSMDMGKNIRLVIKGEQTEIDKNMLEQLSDPLKHIIRNSIDHGIEATEDRVKAGKDEQGTITLSAYHQEGHVVIEVSDDGKGLNKDKLLKKAIEKGLLKADTEYSEKEIFNVIFLPGFSTAEKVTDISGRGVGMDVVRVNIEKLKGRVEIISKQGEGTSMRLRLPLTLAIIEGITFALGENIFVMPLLSIVENLKVREKDIRSIENKDEMINVRGEYVPLVRLEKLFETKTKSSSIDEGIVVLAETGYRKAAIFVDELLDQQQVVIKSLDPIFNKHAGVAGGTILGDGRIALILDVAGLVATTDKKANAEGVKEAVK